MPLHKESAFGIYWVGVLPIVLTFFIMPVIIFMYPRLLAELVARLLFFFPFWGPLFAGISWWHTWRDYTRSKYLTRETIVFELKMPRTLEKTPQAMEMLFAGLNVSTGEADLWQFNFLKGGVAPIWSFELYSYEGEVRMYVHLWKEFRDLFEAQLYSQYPTIEAHVVTDYLSGLHYDKKIMKAYAIEHRLAKSEALPIRTYMDYALEKPHKKIEQRVDPLVSLFERFSTMGEGEQVMLQLVITKDRQKMTLPFTWIPFGALKWQTEAKKLIDEIYLKTALALIDPKTGKKSPGASQLTPGEIDRIKALERNIEKHRFQVGSRIIYLTKPEKHRPRIRSSNFIHLYRQFDSDNLNRMTVGEYWHQPLDYPWQDYKEIRREYLSNKAIDAFKRRSFFYHPYPHKHMSLTTEELATIYHFPTDDVHTPGLIRIQSQKARAPTNLPT